MNWAQWCLAVCSLGVVIYTLVRPCVYEEHEKKYGKHCLGLILCSLGVVFFTTISTYIQINEQKIKDEANKELNSQLLRLSEDNYKLTFESKKQIEASAQPDLRVDGGKVSDGIYKIQVKNYGMSTAENVQLQWDYSYATEIITKIKELPPQELALFESEVFPIDSSPVMKTAYVETKEKFNAGERALIVRLKVTYVWQGNNKESPEYTIIWDGKKLLLL